MLTTRNKSESKRERAWTRWLLQSARTWEDITGIVRMTGVPEVDRDHRKLTEYTLELNRIIQVFSDRDASLENLNRSEEMFRRLYDYTVEHFDREEVLMRESGSPMLKVQMEQHALFLGMLEDQHKEFEQGRLQMISGLKLFILDWVVNHINGIDYQTFVSSGAVGKKVARP